jgi:hypothetical protein
MEFRTRMLGAAAGTAVLGLAALTIADAAASHPSHPQATTLAAVSHTRPSAAPDRKQIAARKQLAAGKQLAGGSSRPVGRPAGSAPNPPRREGRVIPAMFKEAGGELVFYGVRIRLAELPGTTFGIMAGLRDTAGRLTPEVEANETAGPDTATGFHAVQAATSVGSPAAAIPEFGYYAGPATAITARDAGRLVHAHLARWSVNPRIVIFWFTPPAAPDGTSPHGLAAYDHAGHRLPAGNTTPGHG